MAASGRTAATPRGSARATAWRGFPAEGPGSVATFGVRLGAFFVDGILSDLISILVLGGWKTGNEQSLVVLGAFLLIELLFVGIAGQTPGMRLLGIAVTKYGSGERQKFGWIAVRTLLIATVIPALIPDAEGRCLHDRAAGTATIRTR